MLLDSFLAATAMSLDIAPLIYFVLIMLRRSRQLRAEATRRLAEIRAESDRREAEYQAQRQQINDSYLNSMRQLRELMQAPHDDWRRRDRDPPRTTLWEHLDE